MSSADPISDSGVRGQAACDPELEETVPLLRKVDATRRDGSGLQWVCICTVFCFVVVCGVCYWSSSHDVAKRSQPFPSVIPVPREYNLNWQKLHDTLCAEAAGFQPAAEGHSKLVLIGDSITEGWRGTAWGSPYPSAEGVPKVLSDTLAARWPAPLVLAIAGDQTQHVLWRLAHGEMPSAVASADQVVFVLLIGTNNIGSHRSPEETHAGIEAVARDVLTRSSGKLLVNAILPRQKQFMPAMRKVNNMLRRSMKSLGQEFPHRVGYVDCGGPFLDDRAEVKVSLMPDKVHPNAAGYLLLAQCFEDALLNLTKMTG